MLRVVVMGQVGRRSRFGGPGATRAPLAVEEAVKGDAALAFARRSALRVGDATHRGVR